MTHTRYYFIFIGLILVIGAILLISRGTKTQDGITASVGDTILQENLETNTMTQTNEANPVAVFTTSMGTIEIEIFQDKTPLTAENFIKLVSNNFYDGVRFHRVIEGFMVQSGDPLSKDDSMMSRWGTGGPGYTFSDEITEENANVAGTISMANAGPNTNGSQFFINVSDNVFLDDKHTVFGKVLSGYDIVEKIALVDTIPGLDRPVEDVVIESVEIK